MEPDRDRWRPSFPEPGLDAGQSTNGREPGDPIRGSACRPGESEADAEAAIRSAAHQTLRDVTADYETFHFNMMIAKLMELCQHPVPLPRDRRGGHARVGRGDPPAAPDAGPAAPHITEELWSRRLATAGQPWASIHVATWPEVDPSGHRVDPRIPVQVNGKLRDKVVVPADASTADIEAAVLARDKIKAILDGRAPDRIVVAGRRQARQPRRPVTSDDDLAFDRHLDATAPAVADIARALRVTVLETFPDAVETFDAADGLLAIGTADRCVTSRSRSSRTRRT